MSRAGTSRLTILCWLIACGCEGVSVSTSTGESSRNVVSSNGDSLNGDSLNGDSLNGDSLNGDSLNGDSLNGDSLNGDSLNGDSLNGFTLNGSQLIGTKIDGTQLTDSALVGTTFDGVTVGGVTIRLRIDSFAQGTGSNADVYYYGLSWKSKNGWQAVCPNAATAIATMGRWNFGQGVSGGGSWTVDWNFITWSCQVSAITKCVELGYKPWKYVGNASLQPYHQACTRLLRADYCGNGQPYTVNGTLVDLYDGLGIQLDTENWSFEAEWDQNGARCMTGKTRSPGPVPPCQASLIANSCGRTGHFNNGTLLMSEIQ
jgi:hypothetical protein